MELREYSGPFEPPPAYLLENAIGWRHSKVSAGPNRWKPDAWMIVYPDSVLEVNYYTGLARKSSALWAP